MVLLAGKGRPEGTDDVVTVLGALITLLHPVHFDKIRPHKSIPRRGDISMHDTVAIKGKLKPHRVPYELTR